MRRAQSVRTYPRTSLTLPPTGTDLSSDLSLLPESADEHPSSSSFQSQDLRKRLLDAERDNDKLQSTILHLQTQLAARPPVDTFHALEKEYKNLDLILQGTQRENERCMAELERVRMRERLLEQALAKVAGENWQTVLDIAPSSATAPAVVARTMGSSLLNRTTIALPPPSSGASDAPDVASQTSVEATLSQIEQVRLLVLGMEQRMQERQEKLTKTIERAEAQELKCEALTKEVLPTKVAA